MDVFHDGRFQSLIQVGLILRLAMKSTKITNIICIFSSLFGGIFFTGCTTPQPSITGHEVSHLHLLYDLTPVSATNPVVAEVKDCGIEIPASELRAYIDAMPGTMPMIDGTNRPPLALEQKRAALEKLLDEHFLMWFGYQEKADQAPNIVHLLEVTKGMLMREALIVQVIGHKAKTGAEYNRAYQNFLDQIFNQTDVTVSNDAYDQLKASLKLLQQAEVSVPTQTNLWSDSRLKKLSPPVRDAVINSVRSATEPSILDKLTPAVRDGVFARCSAGFVTTGNVLDDYQHIPSEKRPDLETRKGVNQMLEQMFGKSLLTEEARERGFEKSPAVVEKLQLNRNMLVRLYVLGQIGREAEARSKEPGEQTRVKNWYQAHLTDRYTYKDDGGKEHVVPFDQQYERIENDYIDNLREQIRAERISILRKDREIEIDEQELKQLEL